MSDNRIVVYKGTGKVAVETLPYPKLEVPAEVADAMGMSRKADHGVILKCVSTNICGSDQHMVRGRTTAPIGQTLGHEITGEGWFRPPESPPNFPRARVFVFRQHRGATS